MGAWAQGEGGARASMRLTSHVGLAIDLISWLRFLAERKLEGPLQGLTRTGLLPESGSSSSVSGRHHTGVLMPQGTISRVCRTAPDSSTFRCRPAHARSQSWYGIFDQYHLKDNSAEVSAHGGIAGQLRRMHVTLQALQEVQCPNSQSTFLATREAANFADSAEQRTPNAPA